MVWALAEVFILLSNKNIINGQGRGIVGLLMLSWQDIEGMYSGPEEIHVVTGLADSSLPCYSRLSSRAQSSPGRGKTITFGSEQPLSFGGNFLDSTEVQPFKRLAVSQVCLVSKHRNPNSKWLK